MCVFFSLVSDGDGKCFFFKPEDVVAIMASGNKDGLDFNSHTSLMSWLKIKGTSEDKMNKWEYNPETKELKVDELQADDDNKVVKFEMEEFFKGKDIAYLRNLYSMRFGNGNFGRGNSGAWNSGDRNSGNENSGNWNSGSGNSGAWNSGDRNSGNENSGNWNSGNWNSGSGNSGDRNSGDRNSGDRNSGNWNSGNVNSGNVNSGNGYLNSFCTDKKFFLFGKECTKEEYDEIYKLSWNWFSVSEWIPFKYMTKAEREIYPMIDGNICGGYSKAIPYKKAWKKCPIEFLERVQKLKNFDKKIFAEITGIEV